MEPIRILELALSGIGALCGLRAAYCWWIAAHSVLRPTFDEATNDLARQADWNSKAAIAGSGGAVCAFGLFLLRVAEL